MKGQWYLDYHNIAHLTMFKIEQIKQVLTIYETGSINKAAQKLFISQPCISLSIKSLEKEFGHDIFIRNSKGVSLTDFGVVFIENAKKIIHHVEIIEDLALKLSYPDDTLEFSLSAPYFKFAQNVFGQMLLKYQNISTNFRYSQSSVSHIFLDVYSQVADLGLITIPTLSSEQWLAKLKEDHLCFDPIFYSKPHILLPENNKHKFSMQYLKSRPFVVIEEQLPILIDINHQLQEYFQSEKVIFVNDRATAHEMILDLEGFACIMYSENAYKNIPYFDKLISIPISDEKFGFEIGWIQREDAILSSIAQEYKRNVESLLIKL